MRAKKKSGSSRREKRLHASALFTTTPVNEKKRRELQRWRECPIP
jgi:hypothetical protein